MFRPLTESLLPHNQKEFLNGYITKLGVTDNELDGLMGRVTERYPWEIGKFSG